MKAIYQMNADCGRMGVISSIFVAEEEDIEELYENSVYLGEVLGKHSDIVLQLTEDDIRKVSDDPSVVSLFEELEMETGDNPVTTYKEQL